MSTYAFPIKIGLIVFPIIALLITIPFMIKQYHKYGAIPFMRTFIVYSFILYLLVAWFMVILPLPKIEVVEKMTGPWTQLIPFKGLKDIMDNTNFNILNFSTYITTLKNPIVYTVIFNFFLTLPFGVYLRYYFNRKWWEVIILSFMLSLFFEVTQLSCLFGIYPRPYRLFDVDDLIVNTTGGLLGYLITPIFSKILPTREQLDEKSYNMGEKVSYPRRLTATLIDFVIVCLITFSGILKRDFLDLSILMLIFLLYHMLFTVLFKGRTIGKLIVGIRIVSQDERKAKLHQILIRYVVKYIIYFEIFHATLSLGSLEKLGHFGDVLVIVLFISLIVLYLITFIQIIKKNTPLVYETMSNTKHISTIKNKYKKEEKTN